jgi:hypothetical protein
VGQLLGLLRFLIYALAALALYRLWPVRGFLWWTLLASAILMAWTAATVRKAVSDLASVDPAVAINPGLAGHKSADGSRQVVRFWVMVNMVITVVVLALSIWAFLIPRQQQAALRPTSQVPASARPYYEAHCKEPLPVSRLESIPTRPKSKR